MSHDFRRRRARIARPSDACAPARLWWLCCLRGGNSHPGCRPARNRPTTACARSGGAARPRAGIGAWRRCGRWRYGQGGRSRLRSQGVGGGGDSRDRDRRGHDGAEPDRPSEATATGQPNSAAGWFQRHRARTSHDPPTRLSSRGPRRGRPGRSHTRARRLAASCPHRDTGGRSPRRPRGAGAHCRPRTILCSRPQLPHSRTVVCSCPPHSHPWRRAPTERKWWLARRGPPPQSSSARTNHVAAQVPRRQRARDVGGADRALSAAFSDTSPVSGQPPSSGRREDRP